MNGPDSGTMTLAFELSALQALADPEAVFDDARGWAKYVGVVSDEPTYVVTNFTRKNRVRQDFFSGPRGREESLDSVHDQFDTDRHVFVGTDDDDADLADRVGWEYLPVEDAADAAEWPLASDVGDDAAAEEEPVRDDWP
ncbi:hypothetical protein G9C85_07410 [Halorubellus sp. JP-L1]|uniref:DUF7124 domain-containing protein n=1 Tax=Halorubellus sp. JP-L1 TaxID=2715753 RepID=UPI00140A35C8|nr:hypothetical protein [Halorubellus sp. JP-L1]NHN41465.1 hypothetical protein [Halorubellus sp. JP-L1]